jgi:hypothetical protein
MTACVGCAASQHADSADLHALQHARGEITFLRDFPRAPGTAPCIIHAGGAHIIHPGGASHAGPAGGVLHGSCTTRIMSRGPDGKVHVLFAERFHLYPPSSAETSGSFTATLSRTGHVLNLDATGETPQTWK